MTSVYFYVEEQLSGELDLLVVLMKFIMSIAVGSGCHNKCRKTRKVAVKIQTRRQNRTQWAQCWKGLLH